MLLFILITAPMLKLSLANSVQLSTTTSTLNAGKQANYTFDLVRNLSVSGGALTVSALTDNFIIQIKFQEEFDISNVVAVSGGYNGQATFPNNNTVQLYYIASSLSSQILISFQLSKIINPIVTSQQQIMTVNLKNSSLETVDTSSTGLTYSSFFFSKISLWQEIFAPGTVSTLSNFTITFQPDVWKDTEMSLIIGFNRYWTRSLSNLTSNSVFSTASKCEQTCTITTKGSYIEVIFQNLTMQSGIKNLKIININSPPTLEPIDLISLSSIENGFESTVQTGSLTVFSSQSNNLQSVSVLTTNRISETVDLKLTLTTNNLFGPNDTLTVSLSSGQSFASTVTPTFTNGIISSYSTDQISSQSIEFSNFNILTSTYSKMTFQISFINGIQPLRSSQSVTGNTILLKRNGYLYNSQQFSFAVSPILYESPLALQLSNNFANFNSTLSIGPITMTEAIVSSDQIIVKLPKQINIYNFAEISTACLPIACIGCICEIQQADESTLESSITVRNFPATPKTSFILNLLIKNPISSGQNISLCQYASSGEVGTIECLKGQLPSIVESSLESAVISFTNSNDFVYQISNYSIFLNLSQYDLTQGYFLLYFQSGLFLVDNLSIIECTINSQPTCDLSLSTSNQIIIKKAVETSLLSNQYTVKLNNLRNPISTQPFQFKVEVVSDDGISASSVYYTIVSQFYRISNPFSITSLVQASHSPCANSQVSTLTVQIPSDSLPFIPIGAFLVDSPLAGSQSTVQYKYINKQVEFKIPTTTISIFNHDSLQPVRYSFIVKTANLLYDVFSFDITLQNCNGSTISLSEWKFEGLLGEQGQLNIIFDSSISQKQFTYLKVEFPSEYSSSMMVISDAVSTTKLTSPRAFKIQLQNSLPYQLKLWNFTQQSTTSNFVKLSTFLTGLDSKDYLVSENQNSISYDLSQLTSCIFPCKFCSDNSSICLECYSQTFSANYLLVSGTCSETCPASGYFQELNSCSICSLSCKECISLMNCSSCAANFYLLNGSCLTDCPDLYYPISTDQTCESCVFPCVNCVNSQTCITCGISYYLSNTGSCTLNCQTTQFVILNVCRTCEVPCSSCSQQLTNCTTCSSGFYLHNNQCLNICPSPLVPATTTNICTLCNSPCLTCSISPTICTSCQSPYKLTGTTCLTTCEVGLYQISNACIECPSECFLCKSASNCTACGSGFSLYDQGCIIGECPSKFFSKTLQINIESATDTLTSTVVCTSCPENCLSCSNQSYCLLCSSGFISNEGNCIDQCPITMYSNSQSCLNCSKSCLYCADQSICQVCSSTSSLYQDACLNQCLTSMASITVNVTLSANSNQIVETKLCQNCDTLFSQCLLCVFSECTQCQSGYVLSSLKTCLLSCSSGFIDLDAKGFCVECSSQCLSCNSLVNNCTTCATGHTISLIDYGAVTNSSSLLTLRQCVLECETGFTEWNGICTLCEPPCQSCSESLTQCLSCENISTSTILFNQSCISTCPQGYYQIGQACSSCDISCRNCNSYGCLQCSTGYFTSQMYSLINQGVTLSYYDCYDSCPSHLPFVKSGNACSQCASNCVSCNQQECLQCSLGYFIYDADCTVQCPPPLLPYLARCVDPNVLPEPVTQQQSKFIMPVPFTITLLVATICCLFSKLQYNSTVLSLSSYAVGCMLCLICNVYYFIFLISMTPSLISPIDSTIVTGQASVELAEILLLLSLVCNYLLNVFFIILLRHTMFNDRSFQAYSVSHKESTIVVFVIGFVTTHTNYVLLFSRLFGLNLFKAYMSEIFNLKVLNYLWIGQLFFTYGFACLSGALKLALTDRQEYTANSSESLLYACLDLIILNLIMFILGLVNMKKHKEIFQRQEDIMSTQSTTKKVIFDQSEDQNQHQEDYQSYDQFNIKGKNFRVDNDYMLEGGLLPQETEGKFSSSSHGDTIDQNYDAIFIANSSSKSQVQDERGEGGDETMKKSMFSVVGKEIMDQDYIETATKFRSHGEGVSDSDKQTQDPSKKGLKLKMAFQRSINLEIGKDHMSEILDEMKEVEAGGSEARILLEQQGSEETGNRPQLKINVSEKYNDESYENRSLELSSLQNNEQDLQEVGYDLELTKSVQNTNLKTSIEVSALNVSEKMNQNAKIDEPNDGSFEEKRSLDDNFNKGFLTHIIQGDSLQSIPIAKSMVVNRVGQHKTPPKYPKKLSQTEANKPSPGRSLQKQKGNTTKSESNSRDSSLSFAKRTNDEGPKKGIDINSIEKVMLKAPKPRYSPNLHSKKKDTKIAQQFIPHYLFELKYHQQKVPREARVSGLGGLFERQSLNSNNDNKSQSVGSQLSNQSQEDGNLIQNQSMGRSSFEKNQTLQPEAKMEAIVVGDSRYFDEEDKDEQFASPENLKSYLGETFRKNQKDGDFNRKSASSFEKDKAHQRTRRSNTSFNKRITVQKPSANHQPPKSLRRSNLKAHKKTVEQQDEGLIDFGKSKGNANRKLEINGLLSQIERKEKLNGKSKQLSSIYNNRNGL